jgi:alkanesulfonate monooxygenase SsuD/methylene tetrahydromethanopterin reductase-like flavin-dependent oxidoreductase (luciferase family)
METRRDVIVRAAGLADELGYEVFSLPEGWGLDSTAVLTEIALRTRRIRLVSGILSVWGRTPATLAMAAATLDQISGGRYVLGLGTSSRALVEGFHDIPFEHPGRKLAQTVTTVRSLLAGEPAPLSQVPSARPLRLGQPAAPAVPIWVAALGPRTLRVAGELADGWFPVMVARDSLGELAGQLGKLSEAAGREPHAVTVAAGPLTVASDDARAAEDAAAACVAWYLCAMGDVYRNALSRQGYPAEVEAILAANPRPSPRRGAVPPAAQGVVGQLAACGTAAQVREQLEPWDEAAGIVMVGLPPAVPWDVVESTLRAAAPGR